MNKFGSRVFWGFSLLAAAGLAAIGCYSQTGYSGAAKADPRPVAAGSAAPRGGGKRGAPVKAPRLDADRSKRLVVYNASLYMVVEKIADSLERIRGQAAAAGGYLQEMDASSITVKVPAGKFLDTVAKVEKLGQVVKREIKGTDETEKMRDLRARLKNAEAIHGRLLKLLDRAAKMEDTLKIEREIERLTEKIELLKGRIRYLENSSAFSALTVHLNSPLPQKRIATEIPFPWVLRLGADLTHGRATETFYGGRGRRRGVRFVLPKAYIKYYERDHVVRAMSADGVLLRLQRHGNYEGGKAEFWSRLIRRVLVERRAFALRPEAKLRLQTGAEARVQAGSKEIGGKDYGYLIAVVAEKHYVYTFEAWGPRAGLTADRKKIEEAVRSLRIRP